MSEPNKTPTLAWAAMPAHLDRRAPALRPQAQRTAPPRTDRLAATTHRRGPAGWSFAGNEGSAYTHAA